MKLAKAKLRAGISYPMILLLLVIKFRVFVLTLADLVWYSVALYYPNSGPGNKLMLVCKPDRGHGDRSSLRGGSIAQWVGSQIAATPDAIALISAARVLNYKELGERASALADLLQALGVGPNVVVGLCAPRFLDPDKLDISRKITVTLRSDPALTFVLATPLARIEAQIAFEEMVRLFSSFSLEPSSLVWWTNQGLRGLTSLRINFTSDTSGNELQTNPKERSPSSNMRKTESIRKRL
jgi:hypothetical protein